ncbi:MAG: hypothetical protein QW816_04085 [Desulfurococcaceae archaeon]
MGIKIMFIHDFIVCIICLVIGIALTYIYPAGFSIAIFMLFYGFWLLITSSIMHIEHVYALNPRVARSSLASILILISMLIISRAIHLEIRLAMIAFLIALIILIIYIYYLSRRGR